MEVCGWTILVSNQRFIIKASNDSIESFRTEKGYASIEMGGNIMKERFEIYDGSAEAKKAKQVFDSWMTEQLADCSADEAKIIKEAVVSLKKSLRKVYGKSSKYRYD